MVHTINLTRLVFTFLVGLALLPLIAACTQAPDSPEATTRSEAMPHAVAPAASSSPYRVEGAREGLTPVTERNLVCMVNNQYMGKPQIPVEVNGKTYYGCCPMCKERLATNPAARTAIDPVSQKTVDKADAVIAKTPSGGVLYFESSKNLAAYSSRKAL